MSAHEVRLTRIEYWLLEAAVRRVVYLSIVVSGECPKFFAIEGPGGTATELAHAIARLRRLGWAHVTLAGADGDFQAATEVQQAEHLSDVLATRPDDIRFSLTLAGRAAWEAFARPDWDRLIGQDGDWILEGRAFRVSATGLDQDLLRARLAQETVGGVLLSEPTWGGVAEWKPFPWRGLGCASNVTFEWQPDDPSSPMPWLPVSWYRWG